MSKTQLAIHISRTSVHVAEVLRSQQEIVQEHHFDLLESSPEAYRKKLSEIFDSLTSLKEEYSEYSLAWSSPKQTLVPLSVYNDSSAKSIFQLMFGKEVNENTIDFNRLMELSLVNVFEIPDWIKSFFIIKYPQVVIKHEHGMLLRALFQKGAFKLKIVVSFNDEYVNIVIVHKNELKFSNNFEYQSVEDVLYHLMFVTEQEGIKEEAGDLVFFFTHKVTQQKAEQLQELLQKHQLLNQFHIQPMENVLKIQTLCV